MGWDHGGHPDGERFEDCPSECLGEIWVMEVDERVEPGEELDRLDRAERQHLPGLGYSAKDVGDRVGTAEHPHLDGPVDRVGRPQLIRVGRPLQPVGSTVATDDEFGVVDWPASTGRFRGHVDDLDPGTLRHVDIGSIVAEC
jgi:hypothetical protein